MNGARGWTLIEGSFREGAEVPLSDRGFRYGMSVFETLAARAGKILFLKEHLAALGAACRAAGLPERDLDAVAHLGALPDGLLRIYVTAGDGSPAVSGSEPRAFVFFEPARFPGPEEISKGVQLTYLSTPVVPVLGGWKTGNYWQNVMALAAAREKGFDETLILNIQRIVMSAAMANVFFLKAGKWKTPATDTGARRGVVRAWVREMASVEETAPSLEDIREAEECFLTNSRLGIMPVSEIDGRRLPSRQSGEALAAMYRERVLRA